MSEEALPAFPQYPPPNPQGIPQADPKFHKPLYKLMNRMLTPKRKTTTTPRRVTRKVNRKKSVFY